MKLKEQMILMKIISYNKNSSKHRYRFKKKRKNNNNTKSKIFTDLSTARYYHTKYGGDITEIKQFEIQITGSKSIRLSS